MIDTKDNLKKALSMPAGSAGALDSKITTINDTIEEARNAGVSTKFLNYAGWFLQQVDEAKKQEEEKQARGLGGIPGQQTSDLGPKFLVQNEEKFNDKAERALLNEVLKLVEAIRAARKAKATQHLSLDRLSQNVKQYGAVRLLERPFKNQMCGKALSNRRSWSSEGGSKVPLFCRPASPATSCCSCPLAHSANELRFPRGESVKRSTAWLEKAISTSESRADCLPGSKAEWLKTRTPREAPPKGIRTKSGPRRRAKSEPRRVDQLRQSWNDQAHDATQAQGLVARAKVHLQDGQLGPARKCVGEARALATKHAAASAPTCDGASDKAQSLSPRRLDLRSQIRALACEEHPGLLPWQQQDSMPHLARSRELRHSEMEEVHRSKVLACREVYGALEGCQAVETELEIRQRAQERNEEAMLRVSEAQMHRSLQGVPVSSGVGPPLRPGARPQMCAVFLDTGCCTLGDGCPYAHQPAELTGHSRQSLEGLLQMHRSQ